MSVTKQACDLCGRDLGRTVEGVETPPFGLARPFKGTLAMISHYTMGTVGVVLEVQGAFSGFDIAPNAQVTITGAASPTPLQPVGFPPRWEAKPRNPDCEAGKHRACDGRALDPTTDDIVACPCQCHRGTR